MSSIDSLAGGFIESYSIGCIFYGIAISQGYVYFRTCERDPLWMKWMAGTVLVLETFHTAFYLRQMYFYTARAVANPLNLGTVDWSVSVCLVLEIVIEMIVDVFYIHRMWSFTKNVVLAAFMVLILLARHATFLYIAAQTAISESWVDFERPVMKANVLSTLCLVIVLDITVASTMVYYLNRGRSAMRRTRGVVTWLVMYYVNTGVIMAALAVAILIAYLAVPGSLLYAGFINIYAKVMANSIFGALNSRQVLRAKMAAPVIIDTNAYAHEPTSYGMDSIRVEVSRETRKTIELLDKS
ncbi:hypothetical protein QCA50_019260 [Cerrena zonata]|uniref:DUF6534 domain-containing protein n=1 Tax=Cerrena zonata TaxID=2478898 RepID=A0AAW0F9M8_9APHY